MCDGAEERQLFVGHPHAVRRRDHRTVPVLHPVVCRPRQVVGDEDVRHFVGRELAEDRALFSNDLLHARRKAFDVGGASLVVDGNPELLIHLERMQGEAAQLGRTVDQVLEVGGRKRARIARRTQLGRDLPVVGCVEGDACGSWLEPPRPHERGRNIQMRVRGVDRQVRAVDPIAEHFVANPHRSAVAADVPLRRTGACHGQRPARAVIDLDVVDVLGELVDGVPPGRGARHHHFERSRRHVGERDFDLHAVVFGFRKADAIGDRRLRQRQDGRSEPQREENETTTLIPNP
jgi:hypothetical protein